MNHRDYKFSLVMANFNSAKYIKFAIESVLKQTYKNWELIIYDDASKDNYLKVIENFTHDPRIKIFKNKQNEGCGSTKAKAINKASGDLIGIIDSDDALKFDALEIMMEAHKKYFDYGLIYSNYYECNYDLSVSNINKWVGKVKNNSSDIFKARVSHFLTFKKDIYKKISGIDPELRIAEDKDLIYKFEEVSKIRYIDQPLYYYRLRKKSATYGKNSWMADGYCALAKYKAYKRRLGTEVLNFSLPQIADILLIGATKFIISGEFKRAKILFMKSYKFKKVNFLGYCKIIKSFLQEIKHQLWLIKIKFYKKWFSKALLSDGPDIKSEKLISDNYKFIYIAVPKSATRSMMNVFYWEPRYNFFCSLHNGETSEIVAKRNYSKYFKFGFVRNPWSRVVSCFLDKIKKANQDKKKYILNRYPELNLKMSFEEFVFFLCDKDGGSDQYGDRHWISQHKFLVNNEGDILVDFIGRFENLQSDFNYICDQIGISRILLPKLNTKEGWDKGDNSNNRDLFYYRNFYNTESIELIKKRYTKDIELFNYKF